MTPAQHQATRNARAANQGTAAMTESEVRNQAAILNAAIAADDEGAGTAALIALATGMAINLSRIADALTRPG